jgi:hypothetical protein
MQLRTSILFARKQGISASLPDCSSTNRWWHSRLALTCHAVRLSKVTGELALTFSS